jgi:hypothetical protein
MSRDDTGHEQTGKSDAISHLLDQRTSRPRSRSCNVGSAVIVHYNTHDTVCDRYDRLTDHERACVMPRVAHLGSNAEESGCAGVCKD